MRKDELLESIAKYTEKMVQTQHKIEIIRRKTTAVDCPALLPEELRMICAETDFLLNKLSDEVVIMDYIVNNAKKEGL